MKLRQIFLEEKGKPSIKRITGFGLILNAIAGKNLLVLFALFKKVDHYTDIDGSFDNLLYCGIALIFGSIADKYFKRK